MLELRLQVLNNLLFHLKLLVEVLHVLLYVLQLHLGLRFGFQNRVKLGRKIHAIVGEWGLDSQLIPDDLILLLESLDLVFELHNRLAIQLILLIQAVLVHLENFDLVF